MTLLRLLAPILLLAATPGLFTASSDIGRTEPGLTQYDPATRTYTLRGGGGDMWAAADDFHFTWIKLSGNATLTADITLPPATDPTHPFHPLRKGALIYRQSLAPGAPYADIAQHGDGHITLQYRLADSAQTADQDAPVKRQPTGPAVHLRITRTGNLFTASTAAPGQPFVPFASIQIPLQGEIYAGLAVCAHDANSTIPATFTNVQLDQ